jgi:hypothetical protein
MRRAPSVYTPSTLAAALKDAPPRAALGGKWLPARPLGMFSIKSRLQLAWEVFSGRADVLRWPGQER